MKKIILILFVFILSLSLTGCGREPDKTFLVSAICFENENGNILVTAEYISVFDTDTKSGYSAKTAKAEDRGVEPAISRLSASLSKPLFFEHCAVVLLVGNLTEKQTDEVFEYLEKGEIPFSSVLTFVENSSVLKAKTDSNPSVGYTLSYLLNNRAESFGYSAHIKTYEIITARKQKENIFALPIVSLLDDKLLTEQMMVYLDDTPTLKLNSKESIFYAMARNVYEGGRIEINNTVETLPPTKLKLDKAEEQSVTFKINLKNNGIVKELEDFLNMMLKNGVNLISKREVKNITIKGEPLN